MKLKLFEGNATISGHLIQLDFTENHQDNYVVNTNMPELTFFSLSVFTNLN